MRPSLTSTTPSAARPAATAPRVRSRGGTSGTTRRRTTPSSSRAVSPTSPPGTVRLRRKNMSTSASPALRRPPLQQFVGDRAQQQGDADDGELQVVLDAREDDQVAQQRQHRRAE